MSGRCFSRTPLALDAPDKGGVPRDEAFAALSDEVTSELGRLTIMSLRDDASWVDARLPRPQSAPARGGGGR